jgi:hypothetical protein
MFGSRWRTEAEVMRKDANMRRETTDLIDPDTGETWHFPAGGAPRGGREIFLTRAERIAIASIGWKGL